MWQSKRLSSLDTLKDDIGDCIYKQHLGVAYQYKNSHFYIFWHWFFTPVRRLTVLDNQIQYIYCHPDQIIPHTIDCGG